MSKNSIEKIKRELEETKRATAEAEAVLQSEINIIQQHDNFFQKLKDAEKLLAGTTQAFEDYCEGDFSQSFVHGYLTSPDRLQLLASWLASADSVRNHKTELVKACKTQTVDAVQRELDEFRASNKVVLKKYGVI